MWFETLFQGFTMVDFSFWSLIGRQSNRIVYIFTLACVTEDGSRVSKQSLDKSGWLKHIKTIVDGTLLIVQAIHVKNTHVLIHCRYFGLDTSRIPL